MPLSRHALGFVCVLGLGLAAGACTKPSTVLLVEVEGPVDLRPNQLHVTVTAGIDGQAILVPATKLDDEHKMQLPTSFTISLDQSHTAPIAVSIDAWDDAGGVQAPTPYSGTTTYQHVEIGGQTTVTVVLMPPPDQSDGGLDGAAGDGGMAGSGGAGGASGTGGGGAGGAGGSDGGAGGAAGQDAAVDQADDAGLGLDGAAD